MSACRGAVCCCPTVADACCVHLGPLQEWFAALDDNTADALAFVVCVDSIGSGDGLYLHTSKKRTSVVAAPFFAAFERAAEVVGVDLVFNRKKVNLAAAPAWEHEVFARERIPALTVSALAQERPNMQRARLFDDRCVGVGWVCCECVCLLWFTAAISHRCHGQRPPIVQGSAAKHQSARGGHRRHDLWRGEGML